MKNYFNSKTKYHDAQELLRTSPYRDATYTIVTLDGGIASCTDPFRGKAGTFYIPVHDVEVLQIDRLFTDWKEFVKKKVKINGIPHYSMDSTNALAYWLINNYYRILKICRLLIGDDPEDGKLSPDKKLVRWWRSGWGQVYCLIFPNLSLGIQNSIIPWNGCRIRDITNDMADIRKRCKEEYIKRSGRDPHSFDPNWEGPCSKSVAFHMAMTQYGGYHLCIPTFSNIIPE